MPVLKLLMSARLYCRANISRRVLSGSMASFYLKWQDTPREKARLEMKQLILSWVFRNTFFFWKKFPSFKVTAVFLSSKLVVWTVDSKNVYTDEQRYISCLCKLFTVCNQFRHRRVKTYYVYMCSDMQLVFTAFRRLVLTYLITYLFTYLNTYLFTSYLIT
jgi:hypothetical protein